MKMKKSIALGIAIALLLSGCGAQSGAEANPAAEQPAVEAQTLTSDTSGMFTERDLDADYDESASAHIALNGESATSDSDAVLIDGGTITITDEGTYIISGALNDGSIVVNADESDKPQLVLDGVSITSSSSAAIYVQQADKVFVTLASGSENTLANGGEFAAIDDNNIDGTVFSKSDLSFNGSGSLEIVSPAGHGIVCKDDLVFAGGSCDISSASHGIDANDSVRAIDCVVNIVSGKDGIHAENTDDTSLGFVYAANGRFNIDADGDGISGSAYVQLEDGTFDILAGGGSANAAQQTPEAMGGFGGRGDMGGMGGGGFAAEQPQGGQAPMSPGDGTAPPERPTGGAPSGGEPTGAVSTEAAIAGGAPTSGEAIAAAADSAALTDQTEDTSSSGKGLKATGNLLINGGEFTIDSADDAVHSNASITVNGGSFELKTGDDGFHADETLGIAAGKINISESYEGLEGLHVEVSGGEISLIASDDGLNAAGGVDQSGFGGQRGSEQFGGGMSSNSGGSITISGGNLYINASGDGLDANGSLEISGGTVIVSCPTTGDTAVLDYDTSGVITGGTFIGTGALQMAQTFGDSEQGVITLEVGNYAAASAMTLMNSAGDTVLSHAPEQSFALVILSSPDIVKGESYTLRLGSDSLGCTAK